jgi:hypothetical protein
MNYGLANRFVDAETQEPAQRRITAYWVGTAKYASVNVHERRELGRRDDLFSWWYSLAEFRLGALPWGEMSNKDDIYRMKTDDELLSTMLIRLPRQLRSIYRCLCRYTYEQEPDYRLLTSFLVDGMTQREIDFDRPFDWEKIPGRGLQRISLIDIGMPDDEEPFVPEQEHLVAVVVPGEEDASEEDEETEDSSRVKKKGFDLMGCCAVA